MNPQTERKTVFGNAWLDHDQPKLDARSSRKSTNVAFVGKGTQNDAKDVSRGPLAAGVAVFDFDETLTTRHLGAFEDLQTVESRTFGGPRRVAMLREMLESIIARDGAVALVTRNSRHVAKKALQKVGLFEGFFNVKGKPELVFGFEDDDFSTPKSSIIRERVLPALRLNSNQLLFADDDPANIKDVSEQFPEASMVKVPRKGLTIKDSQQIRAWVMQNFAA